MSCCSNSDSTRRFPDMLGCRLKTGYSDTTPLRRKEYMGEKSGVIKLPKTAEITILFKTLEDVEFFWQWYKVELQNGLLDFKIILPLTGTYKEHTVQFKDRLTQSNFMGVTRELKTTLKVLKLNDTFKCQIC